MPTVRFMPRSAEYRYHYRRLERFMKGQRIETHGNVILSQLIAIRSRPSSSRRRRIFCIIASSLCIVCLQNEINLNRKAITVFYPTQEMQIWDDEMFLKMFRFRREQFTELLKAFRLGNKSILCGRKGRAQYFPADVCLMVVLRRFAFPCRFVHLAKSSGLPTHRICDIFYSTIDLLYIRYAKNSIDWKFGKITSQHLQELWKILAPPAAPYDDLAGIFDCHDIEVCRPVGLETSLAVWTKVNFIQEQKQSTVT